MNCKDCIHYSVCICINSGIDCVDCEQCGLEHCIKSDDFANFCDNFKDKSKFIEFPCKVGDEVWACFSDKIRRIKVFFVNCKSEDEHFVFYITCRVFNEDSQFKTFMFGRNVFLTREEAEKALKEQENR